MTTPVAEYTSEEQRTVIQFLWSKGVSGAEIHWSFLTQYRNSALPKRNVYKWIEKFKSGQTRVDYTEGAGVHQLNENNKLAQQIILADQCITVNK